MNLRSRHSFRYLVVAASASLVCLVVAACSPAVRYRALSTVFDGVPPPPGMEVKPAATVVNRIPTKGDVSAFQEGLRQLRETKSMRLPAPTIVSVHKPVAEHRCLECHDMDRPGTGLQRDASLCDKCHLEQRKREGWDHGPINLGTCIPCHVPHRSQFEHLLSKPVPSLCLGCHTTLSPEAPEYHHVANFNECTACHDPHRMY